MTINRESSKGWAAALAAFAMIATAATAPPAAQAATEAEWEAFRADVAAKCLVAAEPMFETAPEIVVDPFGSPSYGLALLSGPARGADVKISVICVYDKQTQTAEIGGELPEAITDAATK